MLKEEEEAAKAGRERRWRTERRVFGWRAAVERSGRVIWAVAENEQYVLGM